MRTCTKCGLEKDLDEFYADKKGPLGRSRWCGECTKDNVRQYNKSRKELLRYKRMEKAALLRDIRVVKESLGMSPERTDRDRLQSVWNQIKQRCRNPNNEKYPIYGERGITVEFEDFKQFYSWSMENGYQQGLQIDRIDNDGPYHPDNCRWVERKENVRNRRVTVTLTAFGETKSVAEWVEDSRCVVGYNTLAGRVRKRDLHPEEMLTLPQRERTSSQSGDDPYIGTVTLTAFGETKSVAEWVEDSRCVVNYSTLIQRVRKSNWSPEEMVTLGPQPNQNGRMTKGQKEFCPQGHPYAEFRKWNKRGDYYCTECARIRNRNKTGS